MGLFVMASFSNPVRSYAQDQTEDAGQAPVDFQTFYDALSPYGSWTQMDPYGYIWIPNVGAGFSPYASNGYWASTDEGWTWVSDFDWGWAPFHYGRWEHQHDLGWFWIPDYTWGPAWVEWNYGPGYYGWAPLGYGITVDMALGGEWHPHNRRWCFVDEGYMGNRNIGGHYIPRDRNVTILPTMHYVNERYTDNRRHAVYIYGPRREDVSRVTHRDIKPYHFEERSTPGHGVSGRSINLYRPKVQNRPGVAPRKTEDVHHITPVQQRDEQYRQSQPEQLHPQIRNTQPFSRRGLQQPDQQRQQPQQQRQDNQQRQQQRQQPQQPQQRQQPQQQRTQPQPQQQRQQPQPQRPQPAPQQRMQSQPAPRMQQSQPAPRMQQSQPEPRQNNNNVGGRR